MRASADPMPVGSPEAEAAYLPRVFVLGLPICMLASWLVLLWAGNGRVDRLGNPIGGDFAMFYIAGTIAGNGQWSELYDETQQQQQLLALFPSLPVDTYLPYRYPPLLALLLAPLSQLPYLLAFGLFTAGSLGVWTASWWFLVRNFIPQSTQVLRTLLLGLFAAPVAVQTLMDGQASLWWFALAAGCYCCIMHERWVWAGSLLALAACKPNVLLLLAVVLIVRYPRLLLGAIPTGCAMAGATWLIAGTDCMAAYVELGQQLAVQPWQVETPYWKVQSLLSWTELVFADAARKVNLFVGFVSAVALAAWWRWTRSTSDWVNARAFVAALTINALLNPYAPVYDLTLLCLGGFILLAAAARHNVLISCLARSDVQISLMWIWLGPIVSQAIAKATQCPQQVMPLGLLVLGIYWWRITSADSRFTLSTSDGRRAGRAVIKNL